MHSIDSKIMNEIDEVILAERAWVEAHRRLDLNVIEKMLSEDYRQIRGDGKVIGKEEVLSSYSSENRQWDFADSDEYHIRIYGATAVLIGRWRARGINNGLKFDYTARFMTVYVKQRNIWQLVSDQSTEIKSEI